MKKLLLSITMVVGAAYAYSQVVVAGVTPAAVQGNYEYTTQANCGSWPGETDDGTWGTFTTGGHDFNTPGYFIQAEAVLVEDGTAGTNPQGNPVSQEGCNGPLTNSVANGNDLNGKIAVIYRNTCSFVQKIQNAQDAGAVAAIIVNREDALIGMLGDATDGPNVTIPAVFISNISGAQIISSIENGDQPQIFIGNKLGAFANDAGAVKGEFLISPYGGAHKDIFTGFDPGIQVYNYGSNDQPNVTVNASIDGPGGNVYDETLGPFNMLSGDTIFLFPGNGAGNEFPSYVYNPGTDIDGDYTLTYTIDLGQTDDAAADNTYSADFRIQDETVSLSRLFNGSSTNIPVSNAYPSNSTTEYSSCMMFQEPNVGTNGLAVEGVYFVPHADTSAVQLAGTEIFVNAYQWDDAWVDLNDAGYTFDPATNDGFMNLNLITFATYYPASDNEVDQVAYATLSSPLTLQDNVRYLFCLQTFDGPNISFGYDSHMDYGANYSIYAQPVSPVMVDGSTYAAGWNGSSATSMGLKIGYVGLDELTEELAGSAYPNPATDVVTVSVEAEGAANLTATDVSGKVVLTSAITLVNGESTVNVANLESGVYIFSVTMENGQTAQFNVVKK